MPYRPLLIAVLTLSLAACNLSDSPQRTPLPLETEIVETTATDAGPTALPGVNTPTPNPNGLPTRTPVGDSAPGGLTSVAPNALPTAPSGESAAIISPVDGTRIGSTLQVTGVVRNLQQDRFTLTLYDADGAVIRDQVILLNNPNRRSEIPWSAVMSTGGYTGPAALQLSAWTTSNPDFPLARVSIVLERGGSQVIGTTEAPVVVISTPPSNGSFSGTTLQIGGTAGGIDENRFTLALVAEDGTIVNSQIVTLNNPSVTQIVPWAAALGTAGYRGPAEIRAVSAAIGSQQVYTSIRITLQ